MPPSVIRRLRIGQRLFWPGRGAGQATYAVAGLKNATLQDQFPTSAEGTSGGVASGRRLGAEALAVPGRSVRVGASGRPAAPALPTPATRWRRGPPRSTDFVTPRA